VFIKEKTREQKLVGEKVCAGHQENYQANHQEKP
jgi:hypothetical protein